MHMAVLALLIAVSALAQNPALDALPAVPPTTSQRKSLSVTTNDVVVVKSASGGVAVVQFTEFGPDRASYRWRYRSAKSQLITNGEGRVRESYDRKPKPDGGYVVTPKTDHENTVRAGEIRMEWSYGSVTNGWLYYHPNRATMKVLGSSAFDGEL